MSGKRDSRMVTRLTEDEKAELQSLLTRIAPDASQADVLMALVEYFEEDESRLNSVKRIARDDRRKFRGPG